MKTTGSENDKNQQGLWHGSLDGKNQGLKKAKSPAKSFVLADQVKRQFTYTLKPSKCSFTDIPKSKEESAPETERQQKTKFFQDMTIENMFARSEYFKLKSGSSGSVSFCSGEKGEHRWTVDMKGSLKKSITWAGKTPPDDESKNVTVKKSETADKEELKNLSNNINAVVQEMQTLKEDFGSVKTDIKTIEKHLRLQKAGKAKQGKKEAQEDRDDANSKMEKLSEDVERAANELRDFIDNNQTLLIENEEDTADVPNFDKIINNLQRLSETAYQPKIKQTSKGAKFEVPREVPISFYADGMLLRNNEFRKYTDIRACLFLRDIEDGFFPSELWPEYPHGVPFQVTDKRFELFDDEDLDVYNKFPGNGRRLGSTFDGKPSSMVYLKPAKIALADGDKKGSDTLIQLAESLRQDKCRGTIPLRKGEERGGDDIIPTPVSLKVRFGLGKNIRINIMSNDKMTQFQEVLFQKLCERYHDEYVNTDGGEKVDELVPDFEIHVYGRKPFRLSENLNVFPSELGIVDSSVVNITEL